MVASTPTSLEPREGFFVSDHEQQWLKVWGSKALASTDLRRLSDHEYRVWWQLVFIASGASPRWRIDVPHDLLARMCDSNPTRLTKALSTLEALRMITRDGAGLLITNAEKYQETPEARRKRRQREREAEATRNACSNGTVTGQKRDMSRDMSREKKREEEEEDPTPIGVGARQAATPAHTRITAEDIARLQEDNPDVDVAAVAEDYLNWTGSAKHKNKLLGLKNQLRSEAVRSRFRRTSLVQRPRDPGAGIPSFDELRNMPWVQGVRS